MLVEAQVSSMNTRRSGSRSSCPSNQSFRRIKISARFCSAACAVFFKRQPAAVEEGPERRAGGFHAAIRSQTLKQFADRQVRRCIDNGRIGRRIVRSGACSIRPSRNSRCGSNLHRDGCPCLWAVRSPVSRARRTHMIAVATPTPKCAAEPRADLPENAASITRSRKSWL